MTRLPAAEEGGPRHHRVRTGLLLVAVAVALWALLAYLVLPAALSHHEHQRGLAGFEMVTRTAQGLPGDPLNVGIVGSREELLAAMAAAGWTPADPVTLRTSIGIVDSVVLDRADPNAPVSPLFYEGRQQDLAFEKPVGISADRRRHVRFWKVLDSGAEGRAVWLGAASLDTGVGLSHYTGAITHAISPDVDATRDGLSADLSRALQVLQTYEITGVGPTLVGRNGEGDRYRTDGEVRVLVLAPPGEAGADPPPVLPNPPLTDLKNAIWPYVSGNAWN